MWMRINKNIMLAALLAVSSAAAQAQRLTSAKEIINVGRVEYRSPVTAEFEIKNVGNAEAHIENIRTNCGCVVAKPRHKTIARGKTISLAVTYDAKQLGYFEKVIGIYARDCEPYYVVMKGVVVADAAGHDNVFDYKLGDLEVDRTSIEFDDVNVGDRPVQKLHIRNATDKEVEPVIMHAPEYLSTAVSPRKIAPGRTGVATITLDSREMRGYGLTQTAVYLGAFPGDTVSVDKEIEVSTVLLPVAQTLTAQQLADAPRAGLAPASLDLGAFGNKKKKSGVVYLKNEGKTPLEIRSIQVFMPGLDVSLGNRTIAPGAVEKIKITAHRDLLQKARTQPRILMITNAPANPKVIITVRVK